MVYVFVEYSCIVVMVFGNKVSVYIMFNEFYCSVFFGYEIGVYVLGKIGKQYGKKVVYYFLFVYGLVMQEFNEVCLYILSGLVFNFIIYYLVIDSEVDMQVILLVKVYFNDWYVSFVLMGKYLLLLNILFEVEKLLIELGDLEIIVVFMVYFGVNYYIWVLVQVCLGGYFEILLFDDNVFVIVMNWEIYL